jgi:hypothetical protein
MNLKEYNNLLEEISNFVKSLNQILYQILILITLYLLFNKLNTIYVENQYQNTFQNNKIHKSFIILFAILAIGLDWFIWNNTIPTTLFIGVITVYIYYNFQNLNIISTFINFTKELSDSAPIITESIQMHNNNVKCNTPLSLELPTEFLNAPKIPNPFDINSTETKEINEVYKSDKPYISITDTKYAEILLNDLYNTPQYKNIKHDEIDTTLDNNIHFSDSKNIGIGINSENINFEYNKSNDELLNSFRNPKKEFLDSSWLTKKTYNDNCISCNTQSNTQSNKQSNKNKGKNAICSVVNFGRELSECTNQEGSVHPEQLDIISNNQVMPLNLL